MLQICYFCISLCVCYMAKLAICISVVINADLFHLGNLNDVQSTSESSLIPENLNANKGLCKCDRACKNQPCEHKLH